MAIQIEDIVNREFPRAFLGYDIREVDAFLDAVVDRLEQLEAQRKQMLTAMEYLLKKLEDTDDLPDHVKKAIANKDKALRRLSAGGAAPAADARGRKSAGKSGAAAGRKRMKRSVAPARPAADESAEETADEQPVARQNGAVAATPAGRPEGTADSVASPVRSAVRVGHTRPDNGLKTKQNQEFDRAATGPEAHKSAPDVDALIPELLSDLETALADSAIRAASAAKKDEPVRSDEGRIP